MIEDTGSDPAAVFRADFTDGRLAGIDAAEALNGTMADDLRDTLEGIERLVRKGRPREALAIAAACLLMSPTELAGLLPSMTGGALVGYCSGLVEAARPFIRSAEQERAQRQERDDYSSTLIDIPGTASPRRRLYG